MKGDLLLVIDMQNVYSKGGKWECRDTEGAASNVLKIEQAKACDKIIFTEFIPQKEPEGVWKDYSEVNAAVNNDVWSNEILDSLKESASRNTLYSKSVYSSLKHPGVLEECRKAKRVVVSGVVAECCVLSTVLELIDMGIYVVYLTDAVSGLDVPKEKATELILSGLSPLHVKIETTAEFLQEK